MKAYRTQFVLVVVLIGMTFAGCQKKASPPAPPGTTPPVKEKAWTPEEIAADPEGYLIDQDKQVARHISERNNRLVRLAERRKETGKKREALAENCTEIENVRNRLERAMRQAEDEDRWPVQMGGRAFTRDKAREIIASCRQYVDDRKPLSEQYDAAMAKLDQMDSLMRKQIQDLERLRERLALDLERVRLNKNMAELGELQKTQVELASFSTQLGAMDENILDTAAAAQKEMPKVDVEKMLNK